MVMDLSPPSRHGVYPAAPYSARPPSPPSIVIPTPNLHNSNEHITVVPSYEKVDPASLSANDLKIITQNHKEQLAKDSAANWTYESRRVAQPILDFIYLGPSSVARDREWLRKTGITMLLAARDSKMAGIRLMATEKVAQELGIQSEYVDVSGYDELIRSFPSVVRTINNHMLDVFRGQRIEDTLMQVEDGKMAIPQERFQRGKVLVFCETGNDRSAGVVVAYLMSVFGLNLVEACQFVNFRRFCVSIADDLKYVLRSYEGILSAQRVVHQHELTNLTNQDDSQSIKARTKRRFDDTIDKDEEMGGVDEGVAPDNDRFMGRRSFAPFVDAKNRHPG
ncbi:phosphatases II [Annulohypoxylon maeteangense]|uniref:phosphatases II n=1 Tax=Annulohypoxylon maeteangense TaxID=1927788 RepID=UPI00200843C9|nr:phosphatases II [Annulohypoxylon maeteangense]KAI0889269.1 phosphatases II [Annulohypoxylon maeteangense]